MKKSRQIILTNWRFVARFRPMARRRSIEVKVVFELERASEHALLQAYHCVQPVARRGLARSTVTKNTTEIRVEADEFSARRLRQVGS